MDTMNELEKAREIIRDTDREMAALFERRMAAAAMVAAYKKEHGLPVYDQKQEERVIARNEPLINDPALRGYYVQFLQNTMAVSRQYQHRLIEGARIAYSGVEGAFAHIAAGQLFPDGECVAFSSFEEAYGAVAAGDCDCAVLPIENSYAGEVGQVTDLMFRGRLFVNGVYDLPITQHLLGVPGASLEGVRTVVSHHQALGQCDAYIRRHGWRTVKAPNTAMAAQQVAQQNDPAVAAIASRQTAALYGLKVLDHDINESTTNTTRFAVFSRFRNEVPAGAKGQTFLLMFTVRNEAGCLADAVNVIGEHGFNMRSLRSRPMRELPWQYYFTVEAEGDENADDAKEMLAQLEQKCELLKVVGRYAVTVDPQTEEATTNDPAR